MNNPQQHELRESTKKYLIEFVGWYGAFAITIAYFANSFGYLASDGLSYQLLNFTGGIALGILTYVKRAYQSTVVNVIWSLIATVALWRIIG